MSPSRVVRSRVWCTSPLLALRVDSRGAHLPGATPSISRRRGRDRLRRATTVLFRSPSSTRSSGYSRECWWRARRTSAVHRVATALARRALSRRRPSSRWFTAGREYSPTRAERRAANSRDAARTSRCRRRDSAPIHSIRAWYVAARVGQRGDGLDRRRRRTRPRATRTRPGRRGTRRCANCTASSSSKRAGPPGLRHSRPLPRARIAST